jgi:hypothetical protein
VIVIFGFLELIMLEVMVVRVDKTTEEVMLVVDQ